MIFQKLDTGNVLVTDNNGISRKLSSETNVLPHPHDPDMIVLTDESRVNIYSPDFRFKWQDVLQPVVTSREDAILKLSLSFFNVDEIAPNSSAEPSLIEEDEENGITYVGYAASDAATTAEAKFKIKKITVSGGITTITYPDGSRNFDKVWDDRATYTYNF